MGDTYSKILIQNTVRKAIRDIRQTPRRSTRNLIDMALQFSTGRFQQEFFRMAQKMLTDEHSAYYPLLQEMATHIDEDKLLTFGMNAGYNGGIQGAARIRQTEQTSGYNIPWTLCLEIDRSGYFRNKDRYHLCIDEGERLGIYTWILFSHGCAEYCLELAVQHPNCAFVLFCDYGDINWSVIDCASELNNLMLCVPVDEDCAVICQLLREAKLLYSVYTFYGEADLYWLQNGDAFRDIEQLHPVFSVFIPKPDCPQHIQELAYHTIHTARMGQHYATILWELYRDCISVDRIISGDGCWACFDTEGVLHGMDEHGQKHTAGSMELSLETLFQQLFPKE